MSCSLFNPYFFYLLFVAQKGAKRPGTEAKSVIIAFAHKSQATATYGCPFFRPFFEKRGYKECN